MIEAIGLLGWREFWLILMGSLITIFVFLYNIIREYIKKYKLVTPLLGDWYAYHYSRTGYNSILRKEKWGIKRTLSGITVQTSDEKRSLLKYKGQISFDSGHCILLLEGLKHPELIQYRLTQPVPNEDTMMLGFHVGKDFDHELFSTNKLVCKNKRTDDEAKKILSSSVKWVEEELCMRLSKSPIETKYHLST